MGCGNYTLDPTGGDSCFKDKLHDEYGVNYIVNRKNYFSRLVP